MIKAFSLARPAGRLPATKLLRAGGLIAIGLFSGVALADRQADWEQRMARAA